MYSLCIAVSLLIWGLTYFYGKGSSADISTHDSQGRNFSNDNLANPSSAVFAAVYAAFLAISVILPNYYDQNINELFVSWQQFTSVDALKLSSGIALSFFFPGYAIVNIIFSQKQTLGLLPKVLVGYILSMFIAGFTGYVLSLMEFVISDVKLVLFAIYLIIFLVFVQNQFRIFSKKKTMTLGKSYQSVRSYFAFQLNKGKLVANSPLVVVFGSLVSLVFLSTSVLHGGMIIGDQWYHHGRAIQFVSGNYGIIDASNADFPYPPLFPALLSSFFVIGDVPTVNAYASVGFLNIMALFAFYYFCKNWVPNQSRKAAVLASALFMLASGFGWIHAAGIFASDTVDSETSAMQTILDASKQTYDIRSPSTFLLASHPDFSTPLQIIILPIGFTLLGIIKQHTANRTNRLWFILAVSLAAALGIFSHDEIYFFIIVASVLPPIFKLPDKNFVYVGLLLATGVALLASHLFSEEYLVSTVIMGIPLIAISLLFIIVAWAVYLTKALEKSYGYIYKISRILRGKLSPIRSRRLIFIIGIVLISTFSYLYVFTLLTWAEIPLKDIETQTSESFPRNVPWYLYPMKLGLVGVLGTCYLLSYIFRRFEKEVFVFGIIAVIAIVTGPYYDEHRFSKYVMVGLIGFASLLLYKMILFLNNTKIFLRHLSSGLLVSLLIVMCSISTLTFIGYDAWSLESNSQVSWLNRRDFPSSPELDMLGFVGNYNSNYYYDNSSNGFTKGIHNIITWSSEYQTANGLLGKFQGFSGIPIPVMLQTPLALNASNLESFYNLLASSGIDLIVIPSRDIADRKDSNNNPEVSPIDTEDGQANGKGDDKAAGVNSGDKSQDIASFALKNFQKIYQDNGFAILAIPEHITPPTSKGDIAIVNKATPHDPILDRSTIFNPENRDNNSTKVVLPYTNQFFSRISKSDFAKIVENRRDVILDAYNKSQTLWSSEIKYRNGSMNYIESQFRIIDRNKDKPHDECGLVWQSGERKYYVRIRDDKLEFSETPAPKDRYNIENQQLKLDRWILYTLKIVFFEDHLQVYVNDMLKLRVPNNLYDSDQGISRIGIRCNGNIAEFAPISIAHIYQLDTRNDSSSFIHENAIGKGQSYQYYYPLSSLALSGAAYDTFLPNDNSIFAKKNIILPIRATGGLGNNEFDNTDHLYRFLSYVRDGGTLTVVNGDKKASGWLANTFFSIKYDNDTSIFNSIIKTSEPKSVLQVFGNTSSIESISPDTTFTSYYYNNDSRISPFSMEKVYGKGKIIFIEAAGYFDAVSMFPEKYFTTLPDMLRFAGIDFRGLNTEGESTDVSFPNSYNIGNITIFGDTIINSSSLLLPLEAQGADRLMNQYHIQGISADYNKEADSQINKTGIAFNNDTNNPITSRDFSMKSILQNTEIRSVELYGQYKATIEASGKLELPSPYSPQSQNDYFGVSIPSGFDLRVALLNKNAHANITLTDGTIRTIKSTTGDSSQDKVTEIYFRNISTAVPQMDTIDLLIKRPELVVHGNVTFESLFQGRYDFDLSKDIEGNRLELTEANVDTRLGYVDSYDKTYENKQTTDYVTYIKSLQFDQLSENPGTKIVLRTPGDISDMAKQRGILVPWKKIMTSETNIVLVTFVFLASLLTTFLAWQKSKRTKSITGKDI